MAPPLAAARIGNHLETLRQIAHLFGIEHDLRGSCQLQTVSIGVGQLRARIAPQGPHKDPLGGIGLCAVAFSGASIPLGQSQLHPVSPALDP